MFVSFFKKLVALFMSALSLMFAPVFGDFAGDNVPKDVYNVRLSFTAISDTHVSDKKIENYRLGTGLDDMANAGYPLDAIVISGDITDHGEREQWETVSGIFAEHNRAKNVILAEGNHDTWTPGDDPTLSASLFREYNEKIAGRTIDNVYYSTKINGYNFVVLGSEGDSVDAYISDEQLQWLSETMSTAAEDGLPIFVVCHQPLNGWHGLPKTWSLEKEVDPMEGGIGEQSDAVKAILTSYDNVFFINGHIHDGLGDKVTSTLYDYKSVESEGSFHSINVPCYSFANMRGQIATGLGFQFEVYDDSVVIRGRSFSSGVWYTCYEYSFDLV